MYFVLLNITAKVKRTEINNVQVMLSANDTSTSLWNKITDGAICTRYTTQRIIDEGLFFFRGRKKEGMLAITPNNREEYFDTTILW
jgi:hypothetical protein